VIRLKEPYGPLLQSLTCLQGTAILPAHVFAGTDVRENPAAAAPIGTGPYRFAEWVRGSHVRMVRNPDYWEEGKPYLDELIAQIIPTAAGRAQALLSGQVDRIPWSGMDLSNYPLIEANPGTELVPTNLPPAINWMFLNVERGPLADKRVRQALFMALDRDYIREAAYGNIGDVGTMPFPAGLKWAADESIDYREMYPFDVERANALLDEAGMRRGADGTRFAVNFIYRNNFGGGAETAAALRSMWAEVGVDVEIIAMENAASTQRVYIDGDFDVFFVGYSSQGDPALGVSRAFHTGSIGIPNGNAARYSNPEIDALFDAAVRAPTREGSAEIYRQIQRILADELPVLPVTEQQHYDAQAVDLEGMEAEFNHAHWRNAWLDR
jgi:peptide/nickel transport system substrate-binding protein